MNFSFGKVCVFVAALVVSACFSSPLSAADISTAAEFLTAITTEPSGSHKLTADIALSGWTPCAFSGELDGNRHKITGLSGSLFSVLSGTVKNLTLDGMVADANTTITVAKGQDFGIMSLTNSGSVVSNCRITGFSLLNTQTATKLYNAIGFFSARANDGCLFDACTVDSSCTVEYGPDICGGLVARAGVSSDYAGAVQIAFSNCVNGATVTVRASCSGTGNGAYGGILGRCESLTKACDVYFVNCRNDGDFVIPSNGIGNHVFGGILGRFSECVKSVNAVHFIGCVNNGSYLNHIGLSNNTCFGGFIGYAGRYSGDVQIDRCINAGNAEATGSAQNSGPNFGGFIGCAIDVYKDHSVTILNSVNRGNIMTNSTISGKTIYGAGAIGRATFNANYAGVKINIRNCSFEGSVFANVAGQVLTTTGATNKTAVLNVDNCWFAVDAPRMNDSGFIPKYAESNLQFYSAAGGGNDEETCAALTAVAAAETTYDYCEWRINSGTGHPEPYLGSPRLTVTFYDWDGTVLDEQKVESGSPAIAPDDPVRPGFVFAGWKPSDFTSVTSNMTIVATYAAPAGHHIVDFVDWDDSLIDQITVADGEKVPKPTDPTREGYTFDAWLHNGVAWNFDTPLTADIVLKASYKLNVHEVKFKDWNGNVVDTQNVQHGLYADGERAKAKLPTVPAGKEFWHWDKELGPVVSSLSVTAVLRETTPGVYVSPSGVDASGRGTEDKPFKTIRYAVSQVSSGRIYVLPGTYVETATVAGVGTGAGCVMLEKAIEIFGLTENPTDVIITHGTWPQAKDKSGKLVDAPSPIVKLDNAGAVLRHVTVSDGAYLAGGNIYVSTKGGFVEHCIVTKGGNSAHDSYGALVYLGGGRMTRSRVCENTSASANGQVDLDGTAQMDNCLLVDLKTGGNHAVKLNGNAVVINCTIARNTGTTGAGVWVNSSAAKVINCLIAGNTAKTARYGIVWQGSNPKSFINCASDYEIAGSVGNVWCRPSFVDFVNGDFRQSIVSACIDAGADVSAYDIGDLDFEGRPRKTGTIDIGCYENNKSDLGCGFNFALDGVKVFRDYNSEFISQTLPATLYLEGGATGVTGTPVYRWTLTDANGIKQVRESSAPKVEWDLATCGRFSIKLEIGGATSSLPDAFQLSPQVMYLTGGSTNSRAPYDTPETAAARLADVYDAAATGAKVIVTPDVDGEIEQDGEVQVLRGVAFTGYSGNPEDTTIRNLYPIGKDGNGAFRILIINHPQALVTGLTLKDGCTRSNNGIGGDIRFDSWGGTVSNCIFRNGKAMHFSSQGGALGMSAGLATHCIFTGTFSSHPAYNGDPSDKGLVIHLDGANARLENSLVFDTVPTSIDDGLSHGPIVSVVNGLIRNCTVVPNTQLFKTTSTDTNYKKWNDDGGCAIRCGSGGRVENCAVAGLKNIGGELKPFGGTMANFYSCAGDGSQDLSATHDCKHATEAEMFLLPTSKDYRPRVSGALHNCAKDVPEYRSIVDLLGLRRVVKVLDIGCYESQYVPGFIITGRRIDD